MPRAASRASPHGRANARRSHPTHPASAKRPRRPNLQLITSDGDAELYVVKRRRKLRPRQINAERVAADPGRELKRLRRGLRSSIEQAAAETKISARYLEALEANASADVFPAGAYARRFLRAYANFLRVDPEPFIAAHPATQPEPPSTVLGRVLREPIGRRFRLPGWLIPGCIAIAAFILLVSTGDRSPTVRSGLYNPPPAAAQTTAAQVPADVVGETPVAPALPVEIVVQLRAIGGRCWVKAIVDGEVVAQRILQAGTDLQLRGTRIVDLVLGNASAAELMINGKPYELPAAIRSVAKVHMVLEDGRVEINVA